MNSEHSDLLNPRNYQGYARLQDNQDEFVAYAISQHPAWIDIWYRLFNDYDRLLAEWRLLEPIPFADFPRVHQMSLHFALATGSIAKVAFDCVLAGYYAQSLMMTRQLFEIWMRLEYVKIQPEAASNWFPSPNGKHPQPPQEGTVKRALSSKGDTTTKSVLKIVEANMEYINKASHASEYVFQQTVTDRPGHYQSGGNYNLAQCVLAMNDGTAAFHLVLVSLADLIDASVPLRISLLETNRLTQPALQASKIDMERYRANLAKNPHWILAEVAGRK